MLEFRLSMAVSLKQRLHCYGGVTDDSRVNSAVLWVKHCKCKFEYFARVGCLEQYFLTRDGATLKNKVT